MSIDDNNTTISFRLPQALHDEVVRLAEQSGVTKHQLARSLIVRALDSADRSTSEHDLSGVEEAFQVLQASMADIRLAMGRGLGAILQEVNPSRNKEEIRRWVFERIITPSTQAGSNGGDA